MEETPRGGAAAAVAEEPLDEAARLEISRALLLARLSHPLVWGGVIGIVGLYWIDPKPILLVYAGVLAMVTAPAIILAWRRINAGRIGEGMFTASIGLWVLAVVISAVNDSRTFALSATLAILPVIISLPYAAPAGMLRTVVITTAVTVVAALAYAFGSPLEMRQPAPWIVTLLVAGYIPLLVGMFGLSAWHSSARLHDALDEMREANVALRASERSLEQKVEDRTSELAHQNEALERSRAELAYARDQALSANRAKSAFLASMSHELRTPLNAVIGFSEVLSERIFGELNEKQAEYVRDIHTSGHHLLSLINDILDLSKVEAGKLELTPSEFPLTDLIDGSLMLMRERAARQGLALVKELDPSIETVTGDERKLKQVLINLLTNAVKFTSEGSITIRVQPGEGEVVISVEDTGIGVPESEQSLIFEEFQQARGDYAEKREGTGLGLALSRRLVELHGGRLWLESEPGAGSTFSFALPAPDRGQA